MKHCKGCGCKGCGCKAVPDIVERLRGWYASTESINVLMHTAAHEIEQLREDRDAWQAQCSTLADDAVRMVHENAALRADAERYRWLCDASGQDWNRLLGAQMTGTLDAAIDAARKS